MSAGSRHPDQSACVKGENDKQPTNQQAVAPRGTKRPERSMNTTVAKERRCLSHPSFLPIRSNASSTGGVSEFQTLPHQGFAPLHFHVLAFFFFFRFSHSGVSPPLGEEEAAGFCTTPRVCTFNSLNAD